MLESNERLIRYYDIKFEPMPNNHHHKDPMPLESFLPNIVSKVDSSVHYIDNSTAALRIADVALDEPNKVMFLLIHLSDTKQTDPAFEGLMTGDVRYEKKKAGEGIAYSAHMAISYIGKGDNYLSLLEVVPGINTTRLSSMMTRFLKLISHHVYFDFKNETNKKCWPKVIFDGHASQPIIEALEKGEISDVELIDKLYDDKIWDEDGAFNEASKTIKLVPIKKLRGKSAFPPLNAILQRAREKHIDQMRIRLKSDDKTPHSIPLIDVNKSESIEAYLVKAETVTFDKDIEQCEENIRKDVTSKLLEMIKEERDNK